MDSCDVISTRTQSALVDQIYASYRLDRLDQYTGSLGCLGESTIKTKARAFLTKANVAKKRKLSQIFIFKDYLCISEPAVPGLYFRGAVYVVLALMREN